MNTSSLLIASCIALSFFLLCPEAHAGYITNAPKYLGLDRGLVGFWSFDGKSVAGPHVYDQSGNGNRGTMTNGPKLVTGKLGQGLSFDGSNDYVDVGSNSSLDLSTFTFCAWVYATDWGEDSTGNVAAKLQSGGFGTTFIRLVNDSGQQTFDSIVNSATQDNGYSLANNGSFALNSWTHLCSTYDNSGDRTIRLYKNGIEPTYADQSPLTGNQTTTSGFDMYIGGGTSVDEFKGILDDIRVYNRVLTADEIKRLYKIGATVKINTTLDGPQSGLVGHWTFDGPALALGRAPDESGSGNEGRLTNGPVRKEGKIGQALQFDGVDDYVEVASNAIYDSTQLAVSLWVKVRAAPPTDNYDVIMTRMDSTVRNGFNLTVDSDAEGGVAEFITMNGTGVVSDVYGSKKITDNAWHHIVMVLTQAQNGTNRLYVDGVLDATDQNTAAWAFNNQVIRIGNELDNANYTPFDGRMDDVRIYNRELTLDEIKRLYKSGSTVKINTTISTDSLTKGLVGHWTFDGKDMAGNHAYDASGNGNRGVLTNGPVRAAGKLGQGLSFDGVNDYVDIQDPANGSLDFGANQDFTYALWVRSTLQPIANKWPVFMNKGDLAGGGARTEIDIALHDSTDDARWFFGIFVNGTGYPNAYGNNDVADGKWHFLVGMRKGSNLITYEDGKPGNIVAASSGSLATGDNQRIGQPTDISSCCNGFKGDIDDVRIYNRALTVDEIKRLYNLAGDTRIATGGSGGGGGSCTADCTIWSPSTVPSNPSENDPSAVELGVKFQSSVAGTVTGIRFYKGGTSNGGTHTGNLWNTGGTNLGTVTFSGESASGWQQADFGTPISISANTTYIASYHAPQGNYAGDGNGLASTVTNAPLSALSSASSGGNGVYVYSASSAFPTETFNASNYYVDVVFDPS